MLSKCANPVCTEPFRYLGEGRLFQLERLATPPQGGKAVRKVEHFWLCDDCSSRMRVGLVENDVALVSSDSGGDVINIIDSVDAA